MVVVKKVEGPGNRYEIDVIHKQQVTKEQLIKQKENIQKNADERIAEIDKNIVAIEKLE